MLPAPNPGATVENPLGFIVRPTRQLQAAVDECRAAFTEHDLAELVSNIRAAFDKYTAKLLEFPPGVERGTALHQLMDQELRAVAQLAVSCHKGCSGCCHYEVEITRDDAAVLKAVILRGFPIDRQRLDLQAARERKSAAWNKFGSPDNRCVFLGPDGACQIYEDRPAVCRKHLVTTPAAACTTAGATVLPVQVLLAEVLLSAAISIAVEGASFASLPKMLSAALRES